VGDGDTTGWHALNASAAVSAANSIEYLMVFPLSGK
jgi:hypothetical protein